MTAANIQFNGSVKPGFEPVRDLYEHNMRTYHEHSTQLCVYHRGEKVVDLWASADGDAAFDADSLVNVFSSGKSLEAIAMASLYDQGLLDYTDKIATHWPEFAANGKGEVTIADLMRHESGLASFDTSLPPADLLTDNIKQNAVGAVIEKQAQHFPEGTDSKREYHAITRGWVANEIFRRLDPKGRTIGEFLREELSGPLGIDVHIGVKDDHIPRIKKGYTLGFGFIFKESLKPKFLGRRIELNFFQLLKRLYFLLPLLRKSLAGAVPPMVGMKNTNIFNKPEVARGETPSANTHANARSLAKIAGAMAMRGRLDDHQVMSDRAWAALHDQPEKAQMLFMNTIFTQGGVSEFRHADEHTNVYDKGFNNGREGFYGWMGYGGSIFQWHPDHQIGLGYVPTSLYALDIVHERGKTYQAEVLRCVEAMG